MLVEEGCGVALNSAIMGIMIWARERCGVGNVEEGVAIVERVRQEKMMGGTNHLKNSLAADRGQRCRISDGQLAMGEKKFD